MLPPTPVGPPETHRRRRAAFNQPVKPGEFAARQAEEIRKLEEMQAARPLKPPTVKR